MILDKPSLWNTLSSPSASTTTVVGCTAAAAVVGYLVALRRTKRSKAESSLLNADDLSSLLLQEESSKKEACIYLDYNGTTPIHPLVLGAMIPFLTLHFGNPSSSHFYGQAPKFAVHRARQSLLQLLQAENEPPSSVWFTGCGTESDNLAIQLALESTPSIQTKHIVTSNVEHPAIDVCLRSLQNSNKVQVTFVPVQPDGRVLAQDVIDALQPNTVLVTLMLANNESGALQPVKQVAQACRQRGILMHTDAAQATGKVDVSLESMGHPDMVTLVGHKIGAPKGVACLYVRHECCQEQGRSLHEGGILLLGGGQEGGRRGGTENVPYIVGMGKAAELAHQHWKTNAAHMEHLRARLLHQLETHLGKDEVRPNGPLDPTLRLPNTLSLGLRHVQSGDLLAEIQTQVAASAGAACHSSTTGRAKISAILQAMQVPMEFAAGTLRLSLGPTTTPQDVDRAAAIIAREAKRQLAKSIHK